MDRATVDVYEQSAGQYEERRPRWRGADAVAFGRLVDAGAPRVDMGCGGGRYTFDLGSPVVAVDAAARAMLELTRQHAPGALLVQADLERPPLRAAAAGGAWSNMAYHHVPRTRLPMALARLHRCLTVGAPVDFTVVRGEYAGHALPDDDFPGRYFACWDEQSLIDVVVGAGFELETVDVLRERNLHVRAHRARSLPDTVGDGMRVLVCGLNPSEYAADAGIAFARPGNRFWPAAVAAGLVSRERDPDHALAVHGAGMTDLVKRATVRASELHADEYRDGMARVERLVAWLEPAVVCFVGLEGWRVAVDRTAAAGWQPRALAGAAVYVMPSTSGLNAHARLADLTAHLSAVQVAISGHTLTPNRDLDSTS